MIQALDCGLGKAPLLRSRFGQDMVDSARSPVTRFPVDGPRTHPRLNADAVVLARSIITKATTAPRISFRGERLGLGTVYRTPLLWFDAEPNPFWRIPYLQADGKGLPKAIPGL